MIVAAAFIGSQLSAQLVPTGREQDTSLLDEVVITANKYPNKTSLTGKVVIIITKEQLERMNAIVTPKQSNKRKELKRKAIEQINKLPANMKLGHTTYSKLARG